MPDDRGEALRQIAWHDVFPWLSLVRAVRLAAAPRLVLLAALGLALTAGGWRAIGRSFSNSKQLDATGWSPTIAPGPGKFSADGADSSLERFHPRRAQWCKVRCGLPGRLSACSIPRPVRFRSCIRFFAAFGAGGVELDRGGDQRIAALAMARDDRLGAVAP